MNGRKDKSESELPLGFTMSLAQHPEAMQAFSIMTPEEKANIIDRARCAQSKKEMQNIVASLDNKTIG